MSLVVVIASDGGMGPWFWALAVGFLVVIVFAVIAIVAMLTVAVLGVRRRMHVRRSRRA